MPGNYTRYGDVTPLVTGPDDLFALFGSGDEVRLLFQPPTAAPEGVTRRYLIYTKGYYKAYNNTFVSRTVDPLPFDAMSNFPYDTSVEQYPTDDLHRQYLRDYNTRTE